MDCSTPGFPVLYCFSQNLLKCMSIESVMPSNYLILCYPLLLLPSVFPSISFRGAHIFKNVCFSLNPGGLSLQLDRQGDVGKGVGFGTPWTGFVMQRLCSHSVSLTEWCFPNSYDLCLLFALLKSSPVHCLKNNSLRERGSFLLCALLCLLCYSQPWRKCSVFLTVYALSPFLNLLSAGEKFRANNPGSNLPQPSC